MYIKIVFMLNILLVTVVPSFGKIHCYKCSVFHSVYYTKNSTNRICADFDQSEKYEVECPYSTMCMKKVLTLKLLDGSEVKTITRDCANQKYTSQVFQKDHWEIQSKIEEAYSEGCIEDEQNAIICHCRGSFCNSAPSTITKDATSFSSDAMTVLFLFNALKFLKNVE